MNPAPVLRLRGRVHGAPQHNPVAPVAARPEQRDEQGNITARALPERPGYDKHDVTVLTEDGGFATVVFREEAVRDAEGYLPEPGDVVDLPVRLYVAYRGPEGRKYATPGLSFSGDVFAQEQRKGSRIAAAV